jgi:hypothetical protein
MSAYTIHPATNQRTPVHTSRQQRASMNWTHSNAPMHNKHSSAPTTRLTSTDTAHTHQAPSTHTPHLPTHTYAPKPFQCRSHTPTRASSLRVPLPVSASTPLRHTHLHQVVLEGGIDALQGRQASQGQQLVPHEIVDPLGGGVGHTALLRRASRTTPHKKERTPMPLSAPGAHAPAGGNGAAVPRCTGDSTCGTQPAAQAEGQRSTTGQHPTGFRAHRGIALVVVMA